MAFYRSGGGGDSGQEPVSTIVFEQTASNNVNLYTFDKAYDRVVICGFLQRSTGSGLDGSLVVTLASGTTLTAWDSGVYNNRRWVTFICDNVQVGDTVQAYTSASGITSKYSIYEV